MNSKGVGRSDADAIVALANSFPEMTELRDLLNGMVRPVGEEQEDGVAPVGEWHVMRLAWGSVALLSPRVWIWMDCVEKPRKGALVAIYC